MITAKNYAAQAEGKLLDLAKMITGNKKLTILRVAQLIKRSVKFCVPDGGKIFDDELRGLIGIPVILPYKTITIEFFCDGSKNLIICNETEENYNINLVSFDKESNIDFWALEPIEITLTKGVNFVTENIKEYDGAYRVLVKEIWDVMPESQQELTIDRMVQAIRVIYELLEALSCRNVETANYQDASPANEKRIKAGKLPLYETKMLVINTHSSTSGKSGNGGGSHASPRQHLRRGHIRRLESGNIWVNSCVVGDPNKGIINKQYSVV